MSLGLSHAIFYYIVLHSKDYILHSPLMVAQKNRIVLKKWMPVALWSLDIKVEVCAICRNHIMDSCVECQNLEKSFDEECSVAWGKCDHAFHSHCISRWLKNKPLCPLDTQPWAYKNMKDNM